MSYGHLPRFMVIGDFEYCGSERRWQSVLEQIGSVNWDRKIAVQVRVKNQTNEDFLRLAALARSILGESVLTVLNGDATIAQELNYDGVHLPQLINVVHTLIDFEWISTVSHNLADLNAIDSTLITCNLVSPVFSPHWKSTTPLGLERLRTYCRASEVPVYALGGICLTKVSDCMASGAYGIASLSGVLDSMSPNETIAQFLSTIDSSSIRHKYES